MRVLIVTDKENSAIWRLSIGVKKHNPHLHVDVIACHPKKPSLDQLQTFERLAKEADILDFQYFKTYILLRELYPELMNKPKILQHHNPYNLFEENWDEFNQVVVNNVSMAKALKKSILIGNTVDCDTFQFNREFEDHGGVVQMVSSRIESKKGVLPVAQVCKNLGYKLLLIGSISKMDYFNEIMETGVVEFREKISEEELVKSYYESDIHVCNSIDGFESGTNPILEAMNCGTPVLTRNIGHVPELYNGKNMVVRKGQPEDLEDLEKELKSLMDNVEKRKKLRENGWNTGKTRDDVRRAKEYEKLYYSVFKENPLVSVIIPTFNRKKTLLEIMESVMIQDYPSIELIICDDGSEDGTEQLIIKLREKINFPIKYVQTGTPNIYNLALARNLGVIEATGEILIFCDDRYKMETDCVSNFVKKLYPKKWLFGNKGTDKKQFVENFSCIYRDEFITAGMFNTSCKLYGFLTQETRERFRRQDFKFEYIDKAKAETILSSKAKYKKRDEIRKSKNILSSMGF